MNSSTLIELSEFDCYNRLRQVQLGRIALCIGALPVVLPVHFGVDPRSWTRVGVSQAAREAA